MIAIRKNTRSGDTQRNAAAIHAIAQLFARRHAMTPPEESLSDKRCVPCKGDVPPMTLGAAKAFLQQLSPEWKIVEERRLERIFHFPDFANALRFADRIGEIAEQEGHHPDLHVGYGRLTVQIWTHKIDGLTLSDFILAAKVDKAATTG